MTNAKTSALVLLVAMLGLTAPPSVVAEEEETPCTPLVEVLREFVNGGDITDNLERVCEFLGTDCETENIAQCLGVEDLPCEDQTVQDCLGLDPCEGEPLAQCLVNGLPCDPQQFDDCIGIEPCPDQTLQECLDLDDLPCNGQPPNQCLGLGDLGDCEIGGGSGETNEISGGSEWYVGALVDLHCLEIEGPIALAGLDLGSMNRPWHIGITTTKNCEGHYTEVGTVYFYEFVISAEVNDATYSGRLLNLFASTVTFDVSEATESWPGKGDRLDYQTCVLAMESSKATKYQVAAEWVANHLPTGVVPTSGTLSYIGTTGGYLINLDGQGTGTFSYTLPGGLVSLGALEAWEWDASLVLAQAGVLSGVAVGSGSSTAISPV